MELERQTHRWVQVSIVEFEVVQSSLSEDDDKIINSGHRYTHSATNDKWIEFHVNDINMKLSGDNHARPFGGNVSV